MEDHEGRGRLLRWLRLCNFVRLSLALSRLLRFFWLCRLFQRCYLCNLLLASELLRWWLRFGARSSRGLRRCCRLGSVGHGRNSPVPIGVDLQILVISGLRLLRLLLPSVDLGIAHCLPQRVRGLRDLVVASAGQLLSDGLPEELSGRGRPRRRRRRLLGRFGSRRLPSGHNARRELFLHVVQHLREAPFLPLQHREDHVVDGAGDDQELHEHLGVRGSDAVGARLSLLQGARHPIELGKDDEAGRGERQPLATSGDRQDGDSALVLLLKPFDHLGALVHGRAAIYSDVGQAVLL
mmetsp:Transcript_47746/g.153716  ORF Transcript_47746/g.153716 Transcript_47746/m.153716 type:complete len:295 (-) Transcript_47746:2358-3242(-)